MRILRSIAAIVAGLGFMSATTTVGMLVASVAFGETREGISAPTPPSEFFYVSLIYRNGWRDRWPARARIATFAPYGHAAAMAESSWCRLNWSRQRLRCRDSPDGIRPLLLVSAFSWRKACSSQRSAGESA
jgi:hypothetical protein